MAFIGVYTAVYDYQPQAEGELEIHENDLLYVLDKDDDDWWKAKKKAADPEDEEPVGLVPNNYVREVRGCLSVRSHSTIMNDRYSMIFPITRCYLKRGKEHWRIADFRPVLQLALFMYDVLGYQY